MSNTNSPVAASSVWTPTELAQLRFWLRTHNSAAMWQEPTNSVPLAHSIADGNAVGQIEDGSLSALIARQNDAAACPVLGSDGTRQSFLEFDGVNDFLRVLRSEEIFAAIHERTNFTLVIPIKITAEDDERAVILDNIGASDVGNTVGFSLERDTSNTLTLLVARGVTGTPALSFTTTETLTASDGWQDLVLTGDGTSITVAISGRTPEVANYSAAAGAGPANFLLHIGCDAGVDGFAAIQCGAIYYFADELSGSDISQLRAYNPPSEREIDGEHPYFGYERLASKDEPNGYPGLDGNAQLVGPLITRLDTTANLDSLVLAQGELAADADSVTPTLRLGDGVNLGGIKFRPAATADGLISSDACVVVSRGSDDQDSADNLRAAYTIAKTLTPGGNALSATNRATVLIPPGRYDFGTGDIDNHGLEVDGEFVDLIGLGSPECTVLTSQIVIPFRGTLEQSAIDVHIANLTLEIDSVGIGQYDYSEPSAYFPVLTSNLGTYTDTILENVILLPTENDFERAMSSRPGITYGGTYRNVCGGDLLFFGTDTQLSGYFERCVGRTNAFNPTFMEGTFIDCVAGAQGFGGYSAPATFIRCRKNGGTNEGSFAGTMIDCDWKVDTGDALTVVPDAVVMNCRISAPSGSNSIVGDGSGNVKVSQCYVNRAMSLGSITNTVATPLNVLDY